MRRRKAFYTASPTEGMRDGAGRRKKYSRKRWTQQKRKKKEAGTIKKLSSIVSQISNYLEPEAIDKIKEDAAREAERYCMQMRTERQQTFGQSQGMRNEKWVLLWATEYVKEKRTNQSDRCKEWQTILSHHCPNKKGITRSQLTIQRYKIMTYNYFTAEQIPEMQIKVKNMLRSKRCTLTSHITYRCT